MSQSTGADVSPEPGAAPGQQPNGPENGAQGGTAGGPSDSAADSASREAAQYRRKLRAAEAERDNLRARMDVRDRREVERLAGESMAAPADLWHVVTDLNGLRDEAGDLDPERVEQSISDVLADRPHWRKDPPRRDPDQGKGNGSSSGRPQGWAALMRGEQ